MTYRKLFAFGAVLSIAAGASAGPTVVLRLDDSAPAQSVTARESTLYRAVTTGGAGWIGFDYTIDNRVAGDPIEGAVGAATPGSAQIVFSIDGEVVCSNRVSTAATASGSLDSDYTFIPSGTHVLLWEVTSAPSSAPCEIWEDEKDFPIEGVGFGEAPTVRIENIAYTKGLGDPASDWLFVTSDYDVCAEPCELELGQEVDESVSAYFSVSSASPCTITATGLPTGLKLRQVKQGPQAGQWYLSGVPSKAGVFFTTLKAVNGNGYAHTAYLRFDVGGRKPSYVNTANIDLSLLLLEPAFVAAPFECELEVPGLDKERVSNIKVTGLPSGMKYSFSLGGVGEPSRLLISGTSKSTSLGAITVTVYYAKRKVKKGSKYVYVQHVPTKSVGKFLVQDQGYTYVMPESVSGMDGSNLTDGIVSGGGVKRIGSTVTVTAKPRDASKTVFIGWYVMDGGEFVPCSQEIAGMAGDYRSVADYRRPSISFPVNHDGMQGLYARFADREEVAIPVSGGISGSLIPAQYPELAAPAGWTLSAAKGLPSGLALKNGKITGIPTATGYRTVTLTYTKGKTSYTRTAVIYVEPLPVWVAGTFTGGVMLDKTSKGVTTTQNGLFTATVSAGGKVSGSYNINGTKVSFTGTGLTRSQSEDGVVSYRAKVVGKVSGKNRNFEFIISQVQTSVTVAMPTATFRGTISTSQSIRELIIRQDLWKRSDAPNLNLPPFIGSPRYWVTRGDGHELELRFGSDGSVKGTLSGDKVPISFSSTLIDVRQEAADTYTALCVVAIPANATRKTKAHSYVIMCGFSPREIPSTEWDEEGNEYPTVIRGITDIDIELEALSFEELEGQLNSAD